MGYTIYYALVGSLLFQMVLVKVANPEYCTQYPVSNSAYCTDIPVVSLCQDGMTTEHTVYVNGSSADQDLCKCQVTATSGVSTIFVIAFTPNVTDCGSKVTFYGTNTNGILGASCEDESFNVDTNNFTFVFEKLVAESSSNEYCISFEAQGSGTVTVRCFDPILPSTGSSTSIQSTRENQISHSTTPSTTTNHTEVEDSQREDNTNHDAKDTTVPIAVGAGAGAAGLITIGVILVFICRRKANNRADKNHDINQQEIPNDTEMTENALYGMPTAENATIAPLTSNKSSSDVLHMEVGGDLYALPSASNKSKDEEFKDQAHSEVDVPVHSLPVKSSPGLHQHHGEAAFINPGFT